MSTFHLGFEDFTDPLYLDSVNFYMLHPSSQKNVIFASALDAQAASISHLITPEILTTFTTRAIEKIACQIDDLGLAKEIKAPTSGVVFSFTFPSMIALPPEYLALRLDIPSNLALGWMPKNFATEVSAGGNQKTFAGLSHFFVFASQFEKTGESLSIKRMFRAAIDYCNDILNAYGFIRHDHSVQLITSSSISADLKCVEFDFSEKKAFRRIEIPNNSSDLGGWLSKRLITEKQSLDLFREIAETLPKLSPAFRETSALIPETLRHICEGNYVNAVLTIDRFSELTIRLIGVELYSDSPDTILKNRALHRKPVEESNPGVLNLVLSSLGISTNQLVTRWQKDCRDERNKLIHGLEFSKLTADKAIKAARSTFELVNFLIDKMPEKTLGFEVLQQGKFQLDQLFPKDNSLPQKVDIISSKHKEQGLVSESLKKWNERNLLQ